MTATAAPILARYGELRLRLVFYPTRQKGPRDVAWQSKTYQLEDYRPGMNVGVFTGTEVAEGKYVADVDYDWAGGLLLRARLLRPTAFSTGRASKSISHDFFLTPAPLPSQKFEDTDGTTLVELRGTNKDGTLGHQTMMPPSIHPSGEVVEFRADSAIGYDDNLPRHVLLYAIGCLLLKRLGKHGFVHEVRLAAAGFLLGAGLSEEETIAVSEAVAEATGNDVRDVATAVRSTAAQIRAGKAVSGAAALAKAFGDGGKHVVARLREWLGADLILDPSDPMPTARAFVEGSHIIDGALTLRRQAGVFYVYQRNVAAYHELAEATVRANLYAFLEKAKAKGKEDVLLPFRPTKDKVSNILDALYAVTNLDAAMAAPCWLAGSPGVNPLDILACPSGLLHIPTRRLLPPTPQFFTLNGLDFDYNPRAAAPTHWLTFLNQLWPEDEQSIETLQEYFGYVLTPDTRFQKIGMIIGPKRSGKGVTGRILRRLVGERNTCSPTLASFGDQFGKQVLIGKTLAIISDARIGGRTDMANVAEALLSISGGDDQTVPRKYLVDWNGKLSARFLLLANELPRIGDVSGALASRFVVLVLTESFYGREDLGLYERLVMELPGILNWALAGRDRLYARGWFVQPPSAQELIDEFEDLSSPEAAMLRECTEKKVGTYVSQAQLFDAWKLWCQDNGRDHPGTSQTFARSVRTALPWVVVRQRGRRGEQKRCWEGMELKATWAGKLPVEELPADEGGAVFGEM